MPNLTLPRQTTPYASSDRDTQLRTVMETADTDTFGVGIVSGGAVSVTAGFGVKLAAGTVIRVEGVTATLAVDLNFTIPTASAANYLWATITRTAAPNSPTSGLDTYAVVLSSNLTGVAPSALHVLVAIVYTDGAGVKTINGAPAGKFLRVTRKLASSKLTIAAGEGANLPADEQLVVSTLTVLGELDVDGVLVVLG